MDAAPPKRNPLLPILIGFLVAGYFDIRFYFIEHHFVSLGSAIVAVITLFIVLFLMRSRFAWEAAVLAILVLAVILMLTYHFGYMGFPLTWPLAIIDLLLLAVFLGYMWRRREPYFHYVRAKEI